MFTIYYYISPSGDNPVKNFLDSLSVKQQVKILRIFQYLKEYGLKAIIPHTRKLSGTLFWEIRILGKDNIRIIYFIPNKDSVLILHGFTKKDQKTPVKEIEICFKRYQSWKTLH